MAIDVKHKLPDGQVVDAQQLEFSYDQVTSCTITVDDGTVVRFTGRPTNVVRYLDDDGEEQYSFVFSHELQVREPAQPPQPRGEPVSA